MNKKTLRIAGWALGLSMAVAGIGVAVGANNNLIQTKAAGDSFTINTSNFTNINGGSGYAAYDGDHSIGGMTFKSSNVMISGGLQFKKNGGYIYNTVAFDQDIETITITAASGLTVYVGTESNPSTTSVTKTGSGPYVYTVGGSYKFFKVINSTSNALNPTSITIALKESAVDKLTANKASYRLKSGSNLNLTACVTALGPNASSLAFEIASGAGFATLVGTTLTGTSAGTVSIHAFYAGTEPLIECSFSVIVYQSATFTKITSESSLTLWSTYAIGTTNGTGAMSSTQDTNNRPKVVSSASETTSFEQNEDETIGEFILVPGAAANQYSFIDIATGKALYAASSSSNYLRSQDNIDGNASFTITISDGAAEITANGSNTRNLLRYNSSNSIFACYGSGQNAVSLYKSNQSLDLSSADISSGAFEFAADIKAEVADQDKDTGTCTTAYGAYKDTYNAFNGLNKAILREHDDSDITFARNRFEAWANYMEGSTDAAWDGKSFSPSPAATINLVQSGNSNIPLIITVAASVGLLTTGGIFLISRRRREE